MSMSCYFKFLTKFDEKHASLFAISFCGVPEVRRALIDNRETKIGVKII